MLYEVGSIVFGILTIGFLIGMFVSDRLVDNLSPMLSGVIFSVLLIITIVFVCLYTDEKESEYVQEHNCIYTGQSSEEYIPIVTIVNNVPITTMQLVTDYFWQCKDGMVSLSSSKY